MHRKRAKPLLHIEKHSIRQERDPDVENSGQTSRPLRVSGPVTSATTSALLGGCHKMSRSRHSNVVWPTSRVTSPRNQRGRELRARGPSGIGTVTDQLTVLTFVLNLP